MNEFPAVPEAGAATLGEAWREHRRYVLDVALHMLGDLGEAEDVVQEAFIRLMRNDVAEIEDARAWLVTVVSRLCLDQLRSARWQRQRPLQPDAQHEPDSGGSFSVDPADRVTLDDSVRLALQVVLERLTPAERTAFVLHDVFRLSFDDVAGVVGRSTEACRQLASRARRQLRGDDDRYDVDVTEQLRVTQAFMSAASTGDLDALLDVLAPDVTGEATFDDGRHGGFRGRDRVALGVLRFLGRDSDLTLLSVPTVPVPSVLALRAGQVVFAATVTVRDGQIHHLQGTGDPTQLTAITAALCGTRGEPRRP